MTEFGTREKSRAMAMLRTNAALIETKMEDVMQSPTIAKYAMGIPENRPVAFPEPPHNGFQGRNSKLRLSTMLKRFGASSRTYFVNAKSEMLNWALSDKDNEPSIGECPDEVSEQIEKLARVDLSDDWYVMLADIKRYKERELEDA